jgi:hypothetical protein
MFRYVVAERAVLLRLYPSARISTGMLPLRITTAGLKV